MDQGRGLQRLSRLFLSQPRRRQFSQLVINQRQQLLGRRRIARFDLAGDLGDAGHGSHCHRAQANSQLPASRDRPPPPLGEVVARPK